MESQHEYEYEYEFTGEIWHWHGPSPFHFVTVPHEQAADIQALAADVTYGWGMIPVRVRLGDSTWKTSLFPKDGGYVLPLKDSIRRARTVELGDTVTVELAVLSPGERR